MRRLVATLAGLALVGVPAAIAMASTDTTSSSAVQHPMVVRQYQGSPAVPFHHHCHRLPGDNQNTSGQPQV